MFGFGANIERDQNLRNLEVDVFKTLIDLGKEEDKIVGFDEFAAKGPKIVSLSVEDALKELLEMEKQLK